jgi:hypothetical protein
MTTPDETPSMNPQGAGADMQAARSRDLRRSALVAGIGILLLAVLSGVATFGVIQAQVVEGDAARTAKAILASEGTFRLGVAALAGVVILDIIVAWALLTFFEPVNRRLATLAAWFRLGYAVVFAVADPKIQW